MNLELRLALLDLFWSFIVRVLALAMILLLLGWGFSSLLEEEEKEIVAVPDPWVLNLSADCAYRFADDGSTWITCYPTPRIEGAGWSMERDHKLDTDWSTP